MLIDIAKQQLKKAGWYEGRKIDISHYQKKFEKLGYDFFPAARSFLEEFGDLCILDKTYSEYSKDNIHVNKSSTELKQFYFPMPQDICSLVGRKIVPVVSINHTNIYVYISEDGKFYCDWYGCGLLAENSDQLWNEYYGEDYGKATWEDLKAGRGRTMRKKKVEQYL